MFNLSMNLRAMGFLVLVLTLGACSKGGELVLEPGAKIVKSKGSPSLRINDGGKALVVQQGQTPSTGVHGWVSIQAVSSKTLSGGGHQALIHQPVQSQ